MYRALVVVALSACGRLGFDGLGNVVGDDAAIDARVIDRDMAAPTFFDNFDRANGEALGNGWIEKTQNAFRIENNRVARRTSGDWTTNQVSRPAGEDLADVEVSIEFTLLDVSQPDWPQVYVRGEPSTFAGYYIWIESGPSASTSPIDIARKGPSETWWTGLDQKVVPAAAAGERYRLRISVTGANPVVVDGYYERAVGSSWELVTSLHGEDTSPEAITGAGTWGFDGHTGTTTGPYTYDNFTAIAR